MKGDYEELYQCNRQTQGLSRATQDICSLDVASPPEMTFPPFQQIPAVTLKPQLKHYLLCSSSHNRSREGCWFPALGSAACSLLLLEHVCALPLTKVLPGDSILLCLVSLALCLVPGIVSKSLFN